MKQIILHVLAVVCLATAFAAAQETRATLTGRVTDPTGAVAPNAQITITNSNTGAVTQLKSNTAGVYTAPFLSPGTYALSVTMPGFETYVHTGLVLQTEQTVIENVVLTLGKVDQTVTVTVETPLVDTADASTGQSLTAEEVEDLPSNGRSPLGYAHLEYGAVAKGKHSMSQVTPFGNSTADDFSLGGGASSSNELLLNGVPNMEDSSRTAGFSPELDAVDEVHVDEFAANAALGDTSGGFVNITTKSGTNELHGSGSEYYNGSRPFEARPYFTSPGTVITSTHFNQFAGTIGGPVYIPHLIHGRNKLFFFYAFEGYIGNSPSTTITSVPTAAEREGDFSALLAYNPADQLYNPNQGSNVAGEGWIRPAIPNNCLTATSSNCTSSNAGLTLDPAAVAYMQLIPPPNYDGASTKPDGENNYYAYDPTSNNYKSNMGRFDYNMSDSDKVFVEGHRSQYNQTSGNIFNNALSGSYSTIILWGGQVDNVKTFSPSLNLETRLGFSRYETFGGPNSLGVSPTSLGFAGYLASDSTALALPYITFSDAVNPASLSGTPNNSEYFDDIQFFASLNKTWGRHSLKFGTDIRSNKDSALSPGAADGEFQFSSSNGDFVTESPNYAKLNTKQAFGGALALFELGLPSCSSTAGCYAINPKYQYDNWYSAFFAQDDWKVMHNLTLSVGLRVEHETPLVESNNKMVQNWYPNMTNATTSAGESNYSSQYAADVAAINNAGYNNDLPGTGSFVPSGGIVYAGSGNRSEYSTAAVYLSPRFGFSFAPDSFHGTLAIRGGFGIYVSPFNDYTAGDNYGFSQLSFMNTTNSSVNGGYTPITTLSNPFPTTSGNINYNPIQPPLGSYFGASTNLGNTIGWYSPVHVPYAEKFSLDVQKQFVKNWLVEIGGIHVEQVHNSYTNAVSSIPFLPYLDHTQSKNSSTALAVSNAMAVKVSNPFLGLMPSYTSSSGATVANTTSLNTNSQVTVSQLLQSYPEYSSVSESLVPGASANFNAFMFRLYKRLSYGLEFDFNYEYSRQLGTTVTQLNPGGPLWYGETTSDFPNHASVTAIYQFPFGKGRMFLNNSTLLDELIGGWQLTSIYQYLSGTPIQWSTNANYSGNFSGFNNHPHNTNGPSFNTSGFDTNTNDQPGSWNFRTFPDFLLRSDPTNNFDFSIMKNFTIWERVIVQPRVDAFNALNHAQMSSANVTPTSSSFAYVTGQLNTNRSLQGGVHIRF